MFKFLIFLLFECDEVELERCVIINWDKQKLHCSEEREFKIMILNDRSSALP